MADTKASALTELTTPALEDLLYIVDDPSGTPTGKKVTLANVFGVALDVGARVYHDANQTITTATQTALSFNQERYDSHGFHDNSTNNNRLTIPTGQGGKYLITFNGQWEVNATGARYLLLILNNTTVIAFVEQDAAATASTSTAQIISTIASLSAGDYIECRVRQSSGGDLDMLSAAQFSPEFSIQRIG